ncbi:MAG: 34-kDa subunit of RNA polymerase III (C) [Vezdaea aestivalis]|nr:MAG: 34-kDa subunit of RNA polymerase III (C) [Vezdaea aestivalis]
MATPRPRPPKPSLDPTIASLKEALYEKAATTHLDQTIDQNGLAELEVVPNGDPETLMRCVNALLDEKLFSLFMHGGRVVWKVHSREKSSKRRTLSTDESLIYSCIEACGSAGAWRRTIQNKTNLHTSVISRGLKSLESRSLIKTVMNVKHPTQRMYMLDELAPSAEMTGGPWYMETGELDEGFIMVVADAAHRFVAMRSFEARKGAEGVELLPMPPGYAGYPTLYEIKRFINSSGVIADGTLDDHAVGMIMDVLDWDGKVEKVRDGRAYKAVRNKVDEDEMGTSNGLTGAPCGTCPVADVCEEGAPVSAKTCEYYGKWLEL